MPSDTFKPPAQIYTTTLYDAPDAFTMLVLPARSLSGSHVPNVLELSHLLGVEELERLPVWTLPMIFDVMMGRPVAIGPEPELIGRVLTYAYRGGRTRGPSAFAQYLAYAPIVPFEASPPKGRALSELATVGGSTAMVVGTFALHEPLVLVTVPTAIIVCRASAHLGDSVGLLLKRLIGRIASEETSDPQGPETQTPHGDDV